MFPYTGITKDTAPLQVDNTVRRGGTQIMKRQSTAVMKQQRTAGHFHTIVGYVPVHTDDMGLPPEVSPPPLTIGYKNP
ncbi:hypothetical protein J6590_065313 [Homalodisca vitripennis]|nr:hypothetical protein J6590_065313 [Homalodisca vitripennis]